MTGSDGRGIGTRKLQGEASACRQFSEAVALVVAVAIDSLQTGSGALKIPPPRAPTPPWRGRIAPIAALSFGRFPAMAPGYGLETPVGPPSFWPIALSLIEWTATRADRGGKGAEFAAEQTSLALCPVVSHGRGWTVSSCFGAELSRLRASGFGLDNDHDAVSWVPALSGRGIVSVNVIPHLTLDGSASVGLPFVRDRFVYRTPDVQSLLLHRPSVISGQLGIALALTIP
jgi:hypothetical protein